jgi:hypothetical protein
MRSKVLAMSSLLLLAATGALAGRPMPQIDQPGRVQSATNQIPGFNDTTTGPTNPRGPVESPDWV